MRFEIGDMVMVARPCRNIPADQCKLCSQYFGWVGVVTDVQEFSAHDDDVYVKFKKRQKPILFDADLLEMIDPSGLTRSKTPVQALADIHNYLNSVLVALGSYATFATKGWENQVRRWLFNIQWDRDVLRDRLLDLEAVDQAVENFRHGDGVNTGDLYEKLLAAHERAKKSGL